MRVERVELGNPRDRERYDRLFEACPDAFIQQSSLWADAIAPIGPDRPVFLVCLEGEEICAGLPLYLFEHALGNVLTSVPQAGPLGGVLLHPGLDAARGEAAHAALLAAAVDVAETNSCLALTLISNPFAPDLERYERTLQPDYLFQNFTQFVPLDEVVQSGRLSLPALERRTNLSRNLRRAQAAGFLVRACASESEFDEWYRLHEARHAEVGARPLSRRLLFRLWTLLVPQAKAQLMLVLHNETIASGCLFVYHRHVMDVFMLSANPDFLAEAPNFLLTEQSLLWAARQHVRVYNWQSSPSRESGVYRYKEQWGSREVGYSFVTKLFGSAERLRALGSERISTEYAGHYVVPFGVFRDGFEVRQFRR